MFGWVSITKMYYELMLQNRFTKLRLINFKKVLDLNVKNELLIVNGIPSSQTFSDTSDFFTIDCSNCIVAPGFIDPQVNGLGNFSFWDFPPPAFNEIDKVRCKLAFCGVVAFCPTVITASKERVLSLIDYINSYIAQSSHSPGAKILGIHIEGIFISKYGVHNPSFVENKITVQKLKPFIKKNVILFTLAPELDPNGEGIRLLQENKILVSIGHSNGSYKQGEIAIKNHNIKMVTHMFNSLRGIKGFSHRGKGGNGNLDAIISKLEDEKKINEDEDGIMLYLLKDKDVLCMLIADGVHVNKEVIKLLSNYKDNDHFSLASDMVSSAFYKQAINQGTLGGGQVTLDKCVSNLIDWRVRTVENSLQAASKPIAMRLFRARELGLGQISFGKEANIVIWDEKKNAVRGTIIGENVFLNY